MANLLVEEDLHLEYFVISMGSGTLGSINDKLWGEWWIFIMTNLH